MRNGRISQLATKTPTKDAQQQYEKGQPERKCQEKAGAGDKDEKLEHTKVLMCKTKQPGGQSKEKER